MLPAASCVLRFFFITCRQPDLTGMLASLFCECSVAGVHRERRPAQALQRNYPAGHFCSPDLGEAEQSFMRPAREGYDRAGQREGMVMAKNAALLLPCTWAIHSFPAHILLFPSGLQPRALARKAGGGQPVCGRRQGAVRVRQQVAGGVLTPAPLPGAGTPGRKEAAQFLRQAYPPMENSY